MRTLLEIITGRNIAYAWLEGWQLRYQSELTRTGKASQTTSETLERARRIYGTWTTGAQRQRDARQVAYDAELARQAQAAPKPWVKAKRKRKRKRERQAGFVAWAAGGME